MTKLRTLIRSGFDVVELLRKLVDEIDQMRDELADIRQQLPAQTPATTKPPKQPPAAETQRQ